MLAERSKNADNKDLPNLTAQMINLANLVDDELNIADARRERYHQWEKMGKG